MDSIDSMLMVRMGGLVLAVLGGFFIFRQALRVRAPILLPIIFLGVGLALYFFIPQEEGKNIEKMVEKPVLVVKDMLDLPREPLVTPPPIKRKASARLKFELVLKETDGGVTINEQLPGPLLRVREGDTVELIMKSDAINKNKHTLKLPLGAEPESAVSLSSGQTKTQIWAAPKAGLYFYQVEGLEKAAFGMILVEPKNG